MKIREALSFDDVNLEPQSSNIASRKHVSLKTNIAGLPLSIPIISSPMPSVTEVEMAVALADLGGLPVIHRMTDAFTQPKFLHQAKKRTKGFVAAAIGIKDDWYERAECLIEEGADALCIDVAFAGNENVLKILEKIKIVHSSLPVIVGNFASPADLTRYFDILKSHGDSISLRVGVGGGSICKTRIVTGFGVPTFQSVVDISEALAVRSISTSIIADGGIKHSGDIVKSLAGGASAVMLGSLLAGTDETPGDVIRTPRGVLVKSYNGAASFKAKKDFNGNTEHVEGVESFVPIKGPVAHVVKNLCEGISSALSYGNALDIEALKRNACFVKVSHAGFRESLPFAVTNDF